MASLNFLIVGENICEEECNADELINKYYPIMDSCSVEETPPDSRSCHKIEQKCQSTDWSSFSPDPKSTFPRKSDIDVSKMGS